MQALVQKAYLLHSRPYKEHQVIAEFLTEQHGKVSAVAYATQSAKNNKKALLQPFTPLSIILKGKSHLKSLSHIEAYGKSHLLAGNFLFSGFYLNELQCKLLGEHIPMQELFIQYHSALTALTQQKPIEPILREFESNLLDELGYAIDFTPIFDIESAYCHYLPQQGFIDYQPSWKGITLDVMHLRAIAKQNLTDERVMQTYKVLMRQAIHHLLDGKVLHSRKLFIKRE